MFQNVFQGSHNQNYIVNVRTFIKNVISYASKLSNSYGTLCKIYILGYNSINILLYTDTVLDNLIKKYSHCQNFIFLIFIIEVTMTKCLNHE